MTTSELVSKVAERLDLPKKTSEAVLKTFIEAIHDSLKTSGEIRIGGLGTFKVVEREPRAGVNPRTGDKMTIPAMSVPSFRAAKTLKESAKGIEKKSQKKTK